MSSSAVHPEIEVILFDVGGVLLTNGWDHLERAAVYGHFQLDASAQAEIEARHPDPYDAWERDTISPDAYLDQVIFFKPRPFSREEFVRVMKQASQPIPDSARGTLEALAASNHQRFQRMLGLLNNESRLLHEYRMETYGLSGLFQVQFSSCYLGLRKPDQAIYRRALDILGLPGERVLFLDDRAGNVAAAMHSGMRAIQFTGEASLRASLESLQIL